MDERENRLAATTSPYLQQHARNPVDWYPWGEEALSRARAEDKPILLSVGYSACHWCHVMAHESFEDDETAALMNREFINIKVDREERPDIDAIYQKVVQLMGQGGGWPLTVFLTPDQRPFYGGTYFPPEPNFGRPGFRQVLVGLADAYRNEPAKIRAQAQRFVDGIAALGELLVDPRQEGGDALADRPGLAAPQALTRAGGALLQHHDPRWGGFGSAPKFPCPTALELWLACAKATSDAPLTGLKGHAATALRRTLEMMWRGGMYDHLRGGFSRYSVDPYWRVPHFEKMLYDNAQLLALYAEASALWPEDAWLWRVVVDTIDYLEADMRAPSGAFYAATDADSEGVEGKYFTWSFEQLTEALDDPALAARIARVYGVTGAGTFEHGLSVLQRQEPLAALAPALGVPEEALAAELEAARARLLARRYTRVPPGLDDKVLTSWNALLISGLCRAAAVAEARGEEARAERVRALAVAALDTLLKEHVQEDGSVLRASFRGRAHTRGFLDDVAGLARACLDVHEHTLDPALLAAARRLAAHFLAHHAREGGGFYLSADDAEPLLDRSEQAVDSASPSGAGVALEVLLRLEADGALDDAPELAGARAHVAATLERLAALVDQPLGGASLIRAAQHRSPDAIHVTVRGEGAATLAAAVRRARLELPGPITLTRGPDVGETSAIVCRGQVCTAPLLEVTELARALSRRP